MIIRAMKKTIGIVVGVLLSVVAVQAQDYAALDRFMKKYCHNWKVGYRQQVAGTERWELVEQLGQPMPEFYFTKQLNSKKLRGKFVVLNFWATWCGGCRILSCDIDTMMRRDPGVYEGVQVIGVDANETLADKGYKAEEWWKEKGIGYPTVGGKNADACCASVNGGHPTAMLVDDKGIIRGRWDAWSPGVASAINLAIWALKVVPEQGIRVDVENVKKYMENGEMLKALYLLELMPENKENSFLRYKCLLMRDKRRACEYFEKLKRKYEADKPAEGWGWTPSEEWMELAREIADCIYISCTGDSETEYPGVYRDVLKNGVDAMRVGMSRGARSCLDYEKLGVLRIKYAEAYRKVGINNLKDAIKFAEDENESEAEVKRLQEKLESYQR